MGAITQPAAGSVSQADIIAALGYTPFNPDDPAQITGDVVLVGELTAGAAVFNGNVTVADTYRLALPNGTETAPSLAWGPQANNGGFWYNLTDGVVATGGNGAGAGQVQVRGRLLLGSSPDSGTSLLDTGSTGLSVQTRTGTLMPISCASGPGGGNYVATITNVEARFSAAQRTATNALVAATATAEDVVNALKTA